MEVDFGLFLNDTNEKKLVLRNEIATLENRKKEAMKPVTILLKEVQDDRS